MRYPVIDMFRTGKHIKDLCDKNNISVKELQGYMGFACPQTIYRWFSGAALPSVDSLFALSRLLNITMNKILIEQREEEFHCRADYKSELLIMTYRRLATYIKSSQESKAA